MSVFRLALLATLLFALPSFAMPPEQTAAWKEDIEHYLQVGEANHIDLYHSTSREVLTAKAQLLIEQLPELSDNQARVELMRIARLIGDGHSAVSTWGWDFVRLPFSLDDYRLGYSGDYRIVEASSAYAALLGKKLVSIDGMPVTEIIARLEPVTQYVENRYSQAIRSRQFAVNVQVLNGLGVVGNVASVELVVEDDRGERSSLRVDSLANSAYENGEKVFVNPPDRVYVGERVLEQSESLWMSAVDEGQTVYLYFAAYPSFEAMNDFARKVREFMEAQQSTRLIVDLRNNGGGDFFTGLVLASQLLRPDSLDWRQGSFVLIGNKVFSASMSNAAQYRQILNARLVGSPTGANPNGYQETHVEQLPNSKLNVTFSKRLYRFQDEASEGIQPDVVVENDWESYQAGKDLVLDWVLSQ